MINHPAFSVLVVVEKEQPSLQSLLSYLQSIVHLDTTIQPQLSQDLKPYDVVITSDTSAMTKNRDTLEKFVRAGGGWLGLVNLSDRPLPDIFGAQPTPVGPLAEVRVMLKDVRDPMAMRLPDAFYLKGRFQSFEITDAAAETILYADWHYRHKPVLVERTVGDGRVACTTLQAYDHPALQQIFYRLLRKLAGHSWAEQKLGVGLLGYSAFIGKQHGMGVGSTPGLEFRAFCDKDPERLAQARQDFPGLKAYDSETKLARDPDVDLVIICSPPDSHCRLSVAMMDSGKHVLCEKPLALSQKDAIQMAERAAGQKVHLSCHQNRRWDVDYLAIKQSIVEGKIGELFYMETFVGGFSHPCGYWHSHAAISGGTAYDWGAHYLDWILSLIPEDPIAVVGTRHKRVWHDVTNADQERVQIRFAGGQEAEFLHSDIAAAAKPKWYLLGTEGSIIGDWRLITEYEIDPDLYFHEHNIPPTEMTPDLRLHRREPCGQIVSQNLALPRRQHYLFYYNLADHLLTGEPIAAPLEQSVLVVAILEAAARSAARGGAVEVLDG